MKSMRRSACLLAAIFPLTAAAVPVTYQFSGTVTSGGWSGSEIVEPRVPLIPWFTEFSGRITIEDSTPGFESGGYSYFQDAITEFSASFGPGGSLGVFELLPAATPAVTGFHSFVDFFDDAGSPSMPYDNFTAWAAAAAQPGDTPDKHWNLSLSAFSMDTTRLQPGHSLLDPWPLDAWVNASELQFNVGYSRYDADGHWVGGRSSGGRITSITQVPVPEPSALWLCAVALPLALRRMRVTRR
jgi:hypothetical protein